MSLWTVVTTGFDGRSWKKTHYCRRSGRIAGAMSSASREHRCLAMANELKEEFTKRYRKNLLTPIPQVKAGQKIAAAGASVDDGRLGRSCGLSFTTSQRHKSSNVGFALDSRSDILRYLPNDTQWDKSALAEYYLYGGGDFGRFILHIAGASCKCPRYRGVHRSLERSLGNKGVCLRQDGDVLLHRSWAMLTPGDALHMYRRETGLTPSELIDPFPPFSYNSKPRL